MTTDAKFAECERRARAFGAENGHAAATWLLDGNSSQDDARRLLAAIDYCDAYIPSPLSGEWGDGILARDVAEAAGLEELDAAAGLEELDELCNAFEEGYSEAYAAEAERSARAML